MKKFILGAVLSLGILVSPAFVPHANAATPTVVQASIIIQLLQAFGVDQSTIATVQAALGGGIFSTGGATLTVNGQTSTANVDPMVIRTWAWSGTPGATYTASGVISRCDDSTQNGIVSSWTPWTGGSGTASSGSSVAIPGATKYGCIITGTYRVTNTSGQIGTATASITFKHANTVVTPPIYSVMGKLTPTGITSYADLTTIGAVDASIAADTGAFPRQDARYARPFDYTKIANDGTSLPATATLGTGAKDWACTKDNLTGLIWEVKTTSGLRSKDNTYTWYNTDPATNGGDVGFASGVASGYACAAGHCGACATAGRCDTEKFAADVNTVGLCGHSSSWRLPTVKELESIVDYEQVAPAVDKNYFPNTQGYYTFTSTLDSQDSFYAWIVDGSAGYAMPQIRNIPLPVRLVWTGSPAPNVYDASCSSTNPFVSNPDNVYDTATVPGTAIDTRNGLMWQRCSVGQTWDGSTCTGSLKGSAAGDGWAWTLQQSVANKFAGFTDWRVPNVKELLSLVEECRVSPSINGTIFPNTPKAEMYYTSSFSKAWLGQGNPGISWVVGFGKGATNVSERTSGGPGLRLVRDVTETLNNIVCTGTVPTTGTTKSSLTPTTSLPWGYSTSGAACTYKCDSTHTWNGSSCIAQVTQVAKKLPPTGITSYADQTTIGAVDASIAADTGAFPRQDARYARPFDYTKIANDGTTLPSTATLGTGAKDWACTQDNMTGLIWEVKTTSGLRSKDNTYTWYNTDSNTNGGDAGTASGGTCATTGRCDTEKFAADVNTAGLCGHSSSWRLPTVKELEGIADFGRIDPAIDTNYFPNTTSYNFWTSTLDSDSSGYINAWIVDGYAGMAMRQVRSVPLPVRLVWTGSAAPNPIPSNPDNIYDTATAPGTAIDTRNGLMWQRCSVGQTWDGSTCTGIAKGSNQGDGWAWVLKQSVLSNFAGFNDWRVPNIKELRSLVEEGRAYPAINTAIFPNTPVQGVYYASSWSRMLPGIASLSWTVGFSSGGVNSTGRSSGAVARLVRDVTTAPVSPTAPIALIFVNGQPSATNVDPLVERTWAWSGTPGATYTASGNITGCETASQNGPQPDWKPWIGGTGTATSGSTSAIPGVVKYGCTIVGTYKVTNATGETTTATATITFKHSYSSSVTCTNWTYGAWRTCSASGTQARTVTNPTPSGCTGGTPLPSTQSCTPPVTPVCTGTHPEAGNGVELSNYSPVVISPGGPANTEWKYGIGSCTWSCTPPMLQDGDTGCKNP